MADEDLDLEDHIDKCDFTRDRNSLKKVLFITFHVGTI